MLSEDTFTMYYFLVQGSAKLMQVMPITKFIWNMHHLQTFILSSIQDH